MKRTPALNEESIPAAIYARYSSHSQRDCSIEQQIADCEAYARANNLRIVKIYSDHHLTGTTDKRPQFQQCLRDSAHGAWKYLICWKIDRFARNRYDSATYKYRLRKNGVQVLYAKESIPEGPEGILLESVLEGSAEYYSANLSQNIRRGMRYNAEQCKVNGNIYPYGYTKGPDGRFAIVPDQADIVREIFSKFLNGTTFVDIANDLNARGILTGRNGRWNDGSFHRLLKNESYIGTYHYADIRVENGMPAIITPDQFYLAQERLRTKKNPHGRHRVNGDYLLTGKLICGSCGSYMAGFTGTGASGDLHYYYGCQKRRREHACSKANIKRDFLEDLVVRAAMDYILQDSVMEWIADCVMDFQAREAASAQLLSLRTRLSDTERSIENIMTAIEAGIITQTTKSRLLELESISADLKSSIALEEKSQSKLTRDQILFFLSRFKKGNPNDQIFRRRVIDTFIDKVYLYDDQLTIHFNYTSNNNKTKSTHQETITKSSPKPPMLHHRSARRTRDHCIFRQRVLPDA